MTRRSRRTLAAGFATATGLAGLFPVFSGAHWFWRVAGAVAVVTGCGLLTRAARLPRVLQPVASLALLAGYLTLVFAPASLAHGLVPTARTVHALTTLADAGRSDIRTYAPPVPAAAGLVMLTAAGVGAVAVLVDLLAVVLDRVALSGLPLLALLAVPSAVLPHGLGGLAFAVGAVGWMALLLEEGSERVSRWGSPLRTALPGARAGGDDTSLGRVGRRIGAAALGLAVVVPAAVPGLDHRLVGGGGGDLGRGDGPSSATTYNPLTTLQQQLTLPRPRQLFVYTTDDPDPDYIRMTTLDRYTGSGWASSRLEADRAHARVQRGIPRPPGESDALAYEAFSMTVAVDTDHLQVHWLPVPYGPRKVQVDGTWLWDAHSQTVFSASRTTDRLAPYTVSAERPLPTRDQLVAAAGRPTDPDVLARYATPVPVSPSAAALARRVTRGARTPYDEAVAVQRWFTDPRHGFVYDVNASLPRRGQDPLDAFLEGRHGFCEQYATAMAALLRVLGIPSRVAVGFTPGQPVPARRGTYRVTTSDAHAWPEAWFAGTGWVRFEPTPAANGATTPDYTLPPAAAPKDTPSSRPAPRPTGSAFPRGLKDPETLLHPHASPDSPLAAAGHAGSWLLAGALLLLLVSAPAAASALRRRHRAARLDPVLAWAQLRDDVHDVAGPWRASASPRTTAALLGAVLDGAGAAAVGRLATAVEIVRYAPPGRASSDGLLADSHAVRQALLADSRAVRQALLASVPRVVRWRALLLAPSTLQWAAHAVGERVADALDLVDRLLSAAFRPARRLLRLRA